MQAGLVVLSASPDITSDTQHLPRTFWCGTGCLDQHWNLELESNCRLSLYSKHWLAPRRFWRNVLMVLEGSGKVLKLSELQNFSLG